MRVASQSSITGVPVGEVVTGDVVTGDVVAVAVGAVVSVLLPQAAATRATLRRVAGR
jgi:hypothetical protein